MIASRPTTPRKARHVARQRNELDPGSADLQVRFALHLRALLEAKKLSSAEAAARITAAGLPTEVPAVNHWLRGDNMPKAKDLETIGRALGLADYRKLLPEPLRD